MIPRYTRPEMAHIWSDENRFSIWLKVETLALEQMVKDGVAPASSLQAVKEKGAFNAARVLEIEQEVKHDVIAFLTNVAEYAGPEARFLHRGMTSSDLLDTSYAVQIAQSGEILLRGLDECLSVVKEKAEAHRYTPCVGRSHGIHAEPTTFGLKLASWYAELARARTRLVAALKEVAVGKIGGAVGTYVSVSPSVEQFVMNELNLTPEAVPTQVVSRDRHASFFAALSLLASSLERFCVEIRHLQRTEVREVEEKFTAGQKGSSAMPHKRNPILSENLSGLARLIRGYALSALENVPLWHERDISHSSVERVITPDACIVMDFMLARFKGLVHGLVVYPERMLENLYQTRGLVFSATLLITFVDGGFTREEAYHHVQRHALAAWDGGPDLRERVLSDTTITARISKSEIEKAFDIKQHFKHVDMLMARAFNAQFK
jgi:adenylosuccinate lyase